MGTSRRRAAPVSTSTASISAFALTGTFAGIGGLMFLAKLTSVSQQSGSNDVNLTAIAAAVIGGTSLFGGRSSTYSALLGVSVLVSISSGLNRIGSTRWCATSSPARCCCWPSRSTPSPDA